jgi:tRNA(Ile)-lysidine synthase TilS/MesJ
LLYVSEAAVIDLAKSHSLPIVFNPCPMNGVSKRDEVKALLKTLSISYPDLKSKIFGAMQRLPLRGWGVTNTS